MKAEKRKRKGKLNTKGKRMHPSSIGDSVCELSGLTSSSYAYLSIIGNCQER
jgi:hypothetical protein